MQWKGSTMNFPSIPHINCAAVLYWRPGWTTIQSAGPLQLKFCWRQCPWEVRLLSIMLFRGPAVGCLSGAAPCLVYLCCQEQCWGCGWDPRFASGIQSKCGVCTTIVRSWRGFSSRGYFRVSASLQVWRQIRQACWHIQLISSRDMFLYEMVCMVIVLFRDSPFPLPFPAQDLPKHKPWVQNPGKERAQHAEVLLLLGHALAFLDGCNNVFSCFFIWVMEFSFLPTQQVANDVLLLLDFGTA